MSVQVSRDSELLGTAAPGPTARGERPWHQLGGDRGPNALLDEYLLQLGMRPSAFVVMALNQWAGLAPEPPR